MNFFIPVFKFVIEKKVNNSHSSKSCSFLHVHVFVSITPASGYFLHCGAWNSEFCWVSRNAVDSHCQEKCVFPLGNYMSIWYYYFWPLCCVTSISEEWKRWLPWSNYWKGNWYVTFFKKKKKVYLEIIRGKKRIEIKTGWDTFPDKKKI